MTVKRFSEKDGYSIHSTSELTQHLVVTLTAH